MLSRPKRDDYLGQFGDIEFSIAEAKYVAMLETKVEELETDLHYCNGVSDLAMKHRDIAEAKVEELTASRDYWKNHWEQAYSEQHGSDPALQESE